MSRNYLRLAVAHLCPSLLNTDKGNLLAFKNRCGWRNIDIEVTEIDKDSRLNPRKYDFYYIGSGAQSQLKLASESLCVHKEDLIKAKNMDALMLGVGAGYFLMGNYYQPLEGEILPGVGLLDIRTNETEKKYTGNTLARINLSKPDTVVGFENNNCLTYLNGETTPLMEIKRGKGNNGEDKTEGAKDKNVFGTYFHGPLLPKNSALCDHFISLALRRKYGEDMKLSELDDDIEKYVHKDRVKAKY